MISKKLIARQKLCYILPEYRADAHTHLSHVYDFIREISKIFDVCLIIEKGEMPEDGLGCKSVKVLSLKFAPLRFFEIYWLCAWFFLKGYRDFYTHYSFAAAASASCAVKVLGGRVFYWNAGEPWKYKRNFFRETFERLTYKLINYLVTGTESLKKEYSAHYGIPLEKIKVMPNWINLEKFEVKSEKLKVKEIKSELKIDDDTKVVLFVHRLSKRKGAHYLPEIIGAFKNEKVVFIIIGDGPEAENSKFEIRNSKLEDKVRFMGWVPNCELGPYYSIADIFILPSEEEGFPRVLLEAMAFGVPFVAFGVGGVLEIIPSELKSFIVPPENTSFFADMMKKMLELPSRELQNIGEIEKLWVRQYDISNVTKIFEKFF